MKFGILLTDSGQIEDRDSEINVGAIWIYQAVLNLYFELGIDEKELIQLKPADIVNYNGEDVLLPICVHIPRNHMNSNVLRCSTKIHPIFLSISMTESNLSDFEVELLAKNAPIGCRDQHTYSIMAKYNIDAYVVGDYVLTTPIDNLKSGDKRHVLYSDVPLFANKFIPEKYKNNNLFIKQEILKSEMTGISPFEYANNIKKVYMNDVNAVITSRFHAAIMAIVYGIPYALVNERYTYRFSWLQKFGNFYTRDNIDSFSINHPNGNISFISSEMKLLAKSLIISNYINNNCSLTTCEKWNGYIANDCKKLIKEIHSFFSNENEPKESPIDYYDGALEHIKRVWNKEEKINYSFWGVNNNSDKIQIYIKNNYPNAVLKNIYDSKKITTRYDRQSVSPNKISNDEFVFVTTFSAKGEALNLFRNINKQEYYICERHYITENVIKSGGG